MKAAILVESLTGNTWRAGEMMAEHLQQAGWGITALSPVKQPDYSGVQAADLVLVGTWVHGLFVVSQAPWGLGMLAGAPRSSERRRQAGQVITIPELVSSWSMR